jgi:Lrp/AsnC family transcriptional regulator for asnA, asnC and gidA
MSKLKIDSLDRKIIAIMLKNARTPYTEVAKRCKVSGAAIHQRINKLISDGIISGSQVNLNLNKMGYTTCAFIGIQVQLLSTKSHIEVFNKIKQIPEIVECHNISGKYSLLIKLYTKNNEHLKNIIIEKIQSIPEVINTETYISLQEGFIRQLVME